MSDTADHNGVPDDDLLAAEFALGVLAGADRVAAQQRMERDSRFAALVAAWEERLAPWAGEITEAAPPPEIWDRIAAALPAQRTAKIGWWQSLVFWRGLSLATGALAAASIGALIYLGNAPQRAPLMAGLDGGGHHHFVATVDTTHGSIAVVPAAFSPDATRVPQLWLIPADGKPRPLGLLSADRAVSIPIPPDLIAQTVGNAVLAVSLEPPGGSPTGLPTGPVIASGKLASL
ncbi:MAG TPA: anti-sigma factor [Pseudolabrys sp.]